MCSRNFKLLIPIAMVFVSPWAHWLVYHNLLLAWPDVGADGGHWLAIAGTGIAFCATMMIADGI